MKSNMRRVLGLTQEDFAWAPQLRMTGVGTSNGPSLAVFQNRLFAASTPLDYMLRVLRDEGATPLERMVLSYMRAAHRPRSALDK
jgi:hypothetical protein